jgi:hypothetical protein
VRSLDRSGRFLIGMGPKGIHWCITIANKTKTSLKTVPPDGPKNQTGPPSRGVRAGLLFFFHFFDPEDLSAL